MRWKGLMKWKGGGGGGDELGEMWKWWGGR